jgi:hypothetical protein
MSTVLTLNGFLVPLDVLPLTLRGTVTFGNAVQTVAYNNFDSGVGGINDGIEKLNTKINTVGGVKIGFGQSEGARAIYGWLRKYGADCTVSPSDLSFVCIGNPERKYGGWPWVERGLPDSLKYDVLDFTQQYDGASDYPDVPNANSQSRLNALWGLLTTHASYWLVAPGDPDNVTTTEVHAGGGTVTYEYAPTKPLPVISQVWSTFTSGQDQAQRATVEAAYDRPVTIPPPTYL